ncbi:nuclear envelope phosphatase-regulatory subunit 1 homolog [Drosophila serrata]|uniref:nuclear envelope phosphatase-regulatory subunit 1 homolog n=1 Tax=Drosophila serrata TaxID=7274 RepID=UPI000A1D0ACA|nr:nuclear envelope phosphatase-regulatory subunit 1 homolog [Drosophila serrata]
MESLPYDDLKAFELRLQEVVAGRRPSRFSHHKLLAIVVFAISLVLYLVPMALWKQTAISMATIILILPFGLDYWKPELSQEEITKQTRSVLEAFDMSCDDTGKLILKAPRSRTPSTPGESP